MSTTTNIKTFVMSAIKPFMISMKRYSDDREEHIRQMMKQQNALIYQAQTLIADLDNKYLDLLAAIQSTNDSIRELAAMQTLMLNDIEALESQVKELKNIVLYEEVGTNTSD